MPPSAHSSTVLASFQSLFRVGPNAPEPVLVKTGISERLGLRHKTIAQWTRQMIRVVRRWLPHVTIVLGTLSLLGGSDCNDSGDE